MPSHSLIIGQTASGKTTLAKCIVSAATKRGRKCAVLDSLLDPEWEKLGAFCTDNQDQFLHYVKTHRDHYIIVDEGGTTIGRYNPAMEWLTTTARHLGHTSFIICHRLKQLPVTLRENCQDIYLFTCTMSDRQMLADEWDQPDVLTMPKLASGDFLWFSRHQEPRRGTIDFKRRVISFQSDRRS